MDPDAAQFVGARREGKGECGFKREIRFLGFLDGVIVFFLFKESFGLVIGCESLRCGFAGLFRAVVHDHLVEFVEIFGGAIDARLVDGGLDGLFPNGGNDAADDGQEETRTVVGRLVEIDMGEGRTVRTKRYSVVPQVFTVFVYPTADDFGL